MAIRVIIYIFSTAISIVTVPAQGIGNEILDSQTNPGRMINDWYFELGKYRPRIKNHYLKVQNRG